MKRRLFIRVFILYVIVLLISIVFIELYLTKVVRTHYIDELKNNLAIQADLISDTISFDSLTHSDNYCRQLKKRTGARVTIIDTRGVVRGDSDVASSLMDNHMDRPELIEAHVSQTGSSIRYSDTLKQDVLYVAKSVMRQGSPVGFVRLSVLLDNINNDITRLRLEINLVVIAVFLLTGVLLIWQTVKIRKFFHQLSDHAGALAHGLSRKKLRMDGAGEFSELAESLNEMGSELQKTVEQRDEETHRLQVIVKSTPDALLIINFNGMVELANNAARDLFGNGNIERKPFIEVVRSTEFISLIEQVQKNRTAASAEITIDVPFERFLSVRVAPLSYRVGELSGFVSLFHDITQTKKIEQMRKDFVANASHEMKTPVTAIKGFAETLMDGALEDRENVRKFLRTIMAQSERLNRLVEDLLTLSRIEMGEAKIEKSDIGISQIIDKVIQTMIVQAAEKALSLKKNLDSEVVIRADRDKLEQVLLNLVDNAIKFSDRGEIEIGVSQENKKIFFYVKDCGIGIPRKYIPRLGERFFRVDPSRSRELGGTGLGLAIVKHIIMAHGWDMNVESEQGKGTIVKVYF